MSRTLVNRSVRRVSITTAHKKVSRRTAENDGGTHQPCHVGRLGAVAGTGRSPSSGCRGRDGPGGSRNGRAKSGSEHGDMCVLDEREQR